MCTLVYFASNLPAPLRPWNPHLPTFHVRELREDELAVRSKFSLRFVYYVGTDEGCGCGFSYGQYPDYEEPAEAERNRGRGAQLRDYLASLAAGGTTLELYACEEGQESEPVTSTTTLQVEFFGGPRFWLYEGQFVHLRQGG